MDKTMRIRNLLLLAFLFHASYHADAINSLICAELSNGALLPNPLSSFSYIMCIKNKPLELNCPSGLCFDRSTLMCKTQCDTRRSVNSCDCNEEATKPPCTPPPCDDKTTPKTPSNTPPCTPPTCDDKTTPKTPSNTPPCTPPPCDDKTTPKTTSNTPPCTPPPCDDKTTPKTPCTPPPCDDKTTPKTHCPTAPPCTTPSPVCTCPTTPAPGELGIYLGILRRSSDAKGMPNGIMSNNRHCQTYYKIISGKAQRAKCPKGQWLDYQLVKCRDIYLVKNCLANRN